MAFRLDPPQSTQYQIQRLALDRIESALEHLSKIPTADADGAERHVHAVRRRCKQTRALARLVRPTLGDHFAPFNTAVRDAARSLAPLRNEHVATQLRNALDAATTIQSSYSASDGDDVEVGDAVESARRQLRLARQLVEGWQLPDGFEPLASGLERTYRRGRGGMASATADPTAEGLHEWRKDVKDLWYQLRLIERISPSMLRPLIDQLAILGEDLGHHHDIAMLIEGLESERHHVASRLDSTPDAAPDTLHALADIERASDRADDAQHQLEWSARRVGATIYAEEPANFVARIGEYWTTTARSGPERSPLPRLTDPDRTTA